LLRSRFTDDDISTLEIRAVQSRRSTLRLLIGTHFNESEPFGSPAEFISDDPGTDHRTVLGEMFLEPFFGHRIGKVSHV
jgi:hypothetical protein